MDIEVGEVLVFAGHRDGKELDYHFNNFKVGKRYEVSGFTDVYYEIDEVTSVGGKCVLFKGETYGCREENLDTYFVRQQDWREGLLSKLLPRYLMELIRK